MPSNRLRTKNQSLTTSEANLDVSEIAHNEDIKSVSIKTVSGTIYIQGKPDDDWIDIGTGIEIDIDFDKSNTSVNPRLKASSTATAGLFFSVYVR